MTHHSVDPESSTLDAIATAEVKLEQASAQLIALRGAIEAGLNPPLNVYVGTGTTTVSLHIDDRTLDGWIRHVNADHIQVRRSEDGTQHFLDIIGTLAELPIVVLAIVTGPRRIPAGKKVAVGRVLEILLASAAKAGAA